MSKKWYVFVAVLTVASTLLAACAQPAEPEVVEVEVTKIVEGESKTVVEVVTATPEPEATEEPMAVISPAGLDL